MKTIRILHMYSDMLDLYGDNGNIEILRYRAKARGIETVIEHHSVGTKDTDFSSYDLIYLGGGADFEQQLLADDLQSCREKIIKAYDSGTFFLLICGGYQLMGEYYKDSNGELIKGLGMFPYHTEASLNKNKRCIGNIIIETELGEEKYKVIGFENHGGQTSQTDKKFGNAVFGNGNRFESKDEGYFDKNVIATYLHGPLLSKNPRLADYIIKYCAEQDGDSFEMTPMDDTLEQKAREVLFSRLMPGNKLQEAESKKE